MFCIILELTNRSVRKVKLPDQRSGLLKRSTVFYGIHLRLKVGAFCQFFRKKSKLKVSAFGRDCFVVCCDCSHKVDPRFRVFRKRCAHPMKGGPVFVSKIRVFPAYPKDVNACIDRNKNNSKKVRSSGRPCVFD